VTHRRTLASVTKLSLFALLAALVLAACTPSTSEVEFAATSLEAATERGHFGVGVTTIELVDTSRKTEPNRDFPGADERRLVVEVWYPAAPSAAEPEARDVQLDARAAPYPLVVFGHGLSSFRRQSASYTQHLASHGYVVASPDFPLSNLTSPGGPRLAAVIEQPGDVSFLIDSLLEFNDRRGHLLEGAIDGEAVGITGHSLGGLTTLLTTYGPSRDPRVRATLPIAAPACFLSEEVAGETSVPILVLGGSKDLLVSRPSVRQGYDVANRPRYFVELAGADHVRFADIDIEDTQLPSIVSRVAGGLTDVAADAGRVAQATGGSVTPCANRPQPGVEPLLAAERQRELLRAFATPFFDAYLRGSDEAKSFLQDELPDLVPEVRFEFDAD